MVYLLPNQTNRPSLLVFSCFSGCVISLPCRLKDQELLNHWDPWFQIEQDFWTKILQFFLLISDNLGGVSWFSFTCWSCKASTYLLNSKEPSSPDDKRVYVQTLGVSPNFEITVVCGLKFPWYLRTLSLKFQKATTKIEVFHFLF